MSFALRPKPIFPILGPQGREYYALNLKPKPTPFMAFLEFCKCPWPPSFFYTKSSLGHSEGHYTSPY